MKIFNKVSAAAIIFSFVFAFASLSFPIKSLAAGPAAVNLMSAGNFRILSKSGITNTGSHTSAITGSIGTSPITGAAMDNVFCSEITGTIFGVDAAYVGSGSQTCFAANPPLANKTLVDNAVLDMQTAYTDAAGRTTPDGTELFAGNLGGQTIAPGLYKWSTDVTIPTDVTLSGAAGDVWIFQIAGNLDIASGGSVPSGTKVILTGGAQASNVFWQVGGVTGATLGTYSTFNGNILSAKQIILQTGAVLNGRALAQTQVTLDANTISGPPADSTPTLPVPPGPTIAMPPLGVCGLVQEPFPPTGFMMNSTSHDYLEDNPAVPTTPGNPLSGNTVDHHWVHLFSPNRVVWDMGAPTDSVFMIPSVDHDVVPAEAHEASLFGSDSLTGPWTAGVETTTYADGPTDWISDNDSTLWKFSQPYRYISALVGGTLLDDGDAEIDALCAPSTISPSSGTSTLHVIKLVVNAVGGTAVPADFSVNVKTGGVDVAGSPAIGLSAPGTSYSLAAGAYSVSETANPLYTQTWSGDCDATGNISLAPGDEKICTIVNTDVALPPPLIPPVTLLGFGGGGGGGSTSSGGIAVPLIGILKVPTPLSLPGGGGLITYNYTVWNVTGLTSLVNVTVTDDKCSPLTFTGGDINLNGKLDFGENWTYSCTTTVSQTTTNTAIATGFSDNVLNQVAIATSIATVVAGGAPGFPNTGIIPQVINITKIPDRLTPFAFGGGDVTYTYTVTNPGAVPMSNVSVVDDKCAPVTQMSGDINLNNLLEPSESWVYTCRAHVQTSTRNVATVSGTANGIINLGYAFATVLVTAPGFPNTGLAPEGYTLWGLAALSIVFALSISFISRKNYEKI